MSVAFVIFTLCSFIPLYVNVYFQNHLQQSVANHGFQVYAAFSLHSLLLIATFVSFFFFLFVSIIFCFVCTKKNFRLQTKKKYLLEGAEL
jgi:hypothetical protein